MSPTTYAQVSPSLSLGSSRVMEVIINSIITWGPLGYNIPEFMQLLGLPTTDRHYQTSSGRETKQSRFVGPDTDGPAFVSRLVGWHLSNLSLPFWHPVVRSRPRNQPSLGYPNQSQRRSASRRCHADTTLFVYHWRSVSVVQQIRRRPTFTPYRVYLGSQCGAARCNQCRDWLGRKEHTISAIRAIATNSNRIPPDCDRATCRTGQLVCRGQLQTRIMYTIAAKLYGPPVACCAPRFYQDV